MALRLIFSFVFFSLFIDHVYSQRSCATDKLHSERAIRNPELYKLQEEYKHNLASIIEKRKSARLAGANDLYTIPVVVHVIYHTSSTHATNISDAQVLSQIQVLNEDFRRKFNTNGYNTHINGADVNIEFCMAQTDPDGNATLGIVRVLNSKTTWTQSIEDEVNLKALSYWPSDKYLNIWVSQMGGSLLGYSQYPVGSSLSGPEGNENELDGVVIDYRAFGRIGTAGNSPHTLYDLGRTTTHEVGHWLGLVHIWGEYDGCGTDYVSDTPDDAGPNSDNNCVDFSDCNNTGLLQADMTANYLDYSRDNCMNLFTLGQKERMRTVMETAPRRLALLSSNACSAPTAVRDPAKPITNSYQNFLDQIDNVNCELFDMMGKRIFQVSLQGNSKSLPLENLTPGLYILRAHGENKELVQKIYIP